MLTHRSRHVPRHRTAALTAALALVVTLTALVVLLLAADAAGAATHRIWERHYAPTTGRDDWHLMEKGPSGRVYVAGTLNLESGNDRMAAACYTASGRRVWRRTFAGRSYAWASALAVDARGNAFLVGQESVPGKAYARLCLLKLASRNGKVVWVRRYHLPGGDAGDFPRGIAVGAKGAVYVTGTIMQAGSGWDAILFKYTDKGSRATRSWIRTYRSADAPEGDDRDEGLRVAIDGRGRLYWGGTSTDATGRTVTFVRRIKVATGRPAWTRRIWADSNDLSLVGLAAFPGGGVALAANRGWVAGLGGGAYVSRLRATGSKVFSTLIDGPDGERVRDLAVGASGDIAIAGSRTDSSSALQSAWVARGNATFSLPWQATYDSPEAGENASFSSVAVGPAGAVYCGGAAVTGFITGWDFTMLKYSSAGARLWVDVYDDQDANRADSCSATLYVGGSRPGLYGAGHGGATDGGEAVLVKYAR